MNLIVCVDVIAFYDSSPPYWRFTRMYFNERPGFDVYIDNFIHDWYGIPQEYKERDFYYLSSKKQKKSKKKAKK